MSWSLRLSGTELYEFPGMFGDEKAKGQMCCGSASPASGYIRQRSACPQKHGGVPWDHGSRSLWLAHHIPLVLRTASGAHRPAQAHPFSLSDLLTCS